MSYEGAQRLIETGMIYELGEAIGKAIAESTEQPTLRDRFAMAALQGMLAEPKIEPPSMTRYVGAAYAFADAMLKARRRATPTHREDGGGPVTGRGGE